jgi:hypothetical protein
VTGTIETARKHAPEIEATALRLIQSAKFEPDGTVLIRLFDLRQDGSGS